MAERITAEQFLAAAPPGWTVADDVAGAVYATGTFAAGVRFVVAVGELADAADHHPDVDLRYPTVTLRLTTHDAGGLTTRDVDLAGRIDAAAQRLGFAVSR